MCKISNSNNNNNDRGGDAVTAISTIEMELKITLLRFTVIVQPHANITIAAIFNKRQYSEVEENKFRRWMDE